MQQEALNVTFLYVSDCTLVVLFIVGLATAAAKTSSHLTTTVLPRITPQQMSRALFALLSIILLALVGFKFIVLSGGPSINTRTILSTSNLTNGISFAATVLAYCLTIVGLIRLALIATKHTKKTTK